MPKHRRNIRIAVIGAGAAGILALIKLKEAGFADITAFEKAADLGGTWRDNIYPGLTCDVPALTYRYSFAPNPDWTSTYAPGDEIQAYFRRVASEFGIEPHIQYNSEVIRAEFSSGLWDIDTSKGPQGKFDAVITAVGTLHHPVYPDIEGLKQFAGPMFHSARWDPDVALEGRRVGIIGNGSTAVQLVSALVDVVGNLTLFQRTAQWIAPATNPSIDDELREKYRSHPELLEAEYVRLNGEMNANFAAAMVGENPQIYTTIAQACRDHLATVQDAELRRRLTPTYEVGCKRLVKSPNFYDAIQRPNAELVTDPIERIEPGGIRTKDGQLHELDALLLATGFDAHNVYGSMTIVGRDGVNIRDAWSDKRQAYKQVTTAGFPNWFMLAGPNTPIANFSYLSTLEHQMGYISKLIEVLASDGTREIAPKPDAMKEFNDALAARLPGTVWASGCNSWYMDEKGNLALWPWNYETFARDLSEPVLDHFEIK
ncbi:MAG: dependent oxidoreductase [Bradyrhizobium sp.]|nr:dependent oxidoreductase [Bradyrhizobium sp.]